MQRSLLTLIAFCSALGLSACDKNTNDKASGSTGTNEGSGQAQAVQDAGPVDFDKLESLKGFIAGAGPSMMAQPQAYILFDPQCPHCGELWRNALPLQQQVKMKWIPVGFIGEKSKTQAGMLIEAKDPVDLMTRYEAEMASRKSSGILDGTPAKETLEQVERNTQAWKNSGSTSVPTIIYRDPKNGGGRAMIAGSAPTASIAALLGVQYPATAPATTPAAPAR